MQRIHMNLNLLSSTAVSSTTLRNMAPSMIFVLMVIVKVSPSIAVTVAPSNIIACSNYRSFPYVNIHLRLECSLRNLNPSLASCYSYRTGVSTQGGGLNSEVVSSIIWAMHIIIR